ncbi:cysteine dioxygenase family protein [Tropicimonas aquimaris]|uniref:Metal-dependent protein of the double-stranded beta helix superfamily-like protein n=1 Tax=Tropicimonas aquimaris TaxID=914152 RepID=A0ABW3IK90_9RHOB
MFNTDHFIADCLAAVHHDPTHKSVEEVVRRAMSDPDDVLAALGEPTEPGITPLYQSDKLTIVNLAWKPSTTIPPHNHEMWAVIGIYGGREDNIFWRRVKDHPDGLIEAAGARALTTGDVCPMGPDIIHSVTNPIPRLTAALHVYGGDFFEAERSEWEPEGLTEQLLDIEEVRRRFSN